MLFLRSFFARAFYPFHCQRCKRPGRDWGGGQQVCPGSHAEVRELPPKLNRCGTRQRSGCHSSRTLHSQPCWKLWLELPETCSRFSRCTLTGSGQETRRRSAGWRENGQMRGKEGWARGANIGAERGGGEEGWRAEESSSSSSKEVKKKERIAARLQPYMSNHHASVLLMDVLGRQIGFTV